MRQFHKLLPISSKGVAHYIVPMLMVGVIAVVGGYVLLNGGSAATPTGAVYLESGISSKCLDDAYDKSANGTKVQSYACNKSAAQEWVLNSNGTIENANGKCLDNAYGKNLNDNPITVYTCSTSSAEIWNDMNPVLLNTSTKKCIDIPYGSTKNATALQLYTCNGTKQQRWTAVKVTAATGSTSTGSSTSGGGTGGSGTTTTTGCSTSGAISPCMNGANTGSGGTGYGSPVFDDEFNKGSLDTSVWTPYWFSNGASSNNTTMESSNVSVGTNGLNLNIASNSTGGLVSTNPDDGVSGHKGFQIQPSAGKSVFVEYNAELPGTGDQAYNWPALWVTGQNWPQTGELDIMEGFGNLQSHTIYSGCGGDCNPGTTLGNWSSGFHTYGLLWTTTSTTFYYDGKSVGGSALPYNVGPLYLVMENSLERSSQAQVPATMTVRYARVWQN
jgi:hypothetical protein